MSLESGKNNFNLNIAHLFWDRLYPRIDTGESWKVKPSLPVTYSKIASNPWYLMYNLHRCFCYQHRNLFEFKIIWFYFNPLYSSSICRQFTKKNVHVDENSKTSITPRKEGSSVREKKNQIWRNATVSIYFIPLLLY